MKEILDLDDLPLTGNVVIEILGMLTDKTCKAAELEKVIERDPGLSAQVLKIANSAFYGLRGNVNSIARAMVLIGMEEVRNVALTVCLMNQFRSSSMARSFDSFSFWHHSIMTGLLAREIADQINLVRGSEAYVMGLLHDLGILGMASKLAVHYDRISSLESRRNIVRYEIEKSLTIPHTLVGYWIADRWSLPEVLKETILWHHEPLEGEKFVAESALIHVADLITTQADHMESSEQMSDLLDTEIFSRVGMDSEILADLFSLKVNMEKEVRGLSTVLGSA